MADALMQIGNEPRGLLASAVQSADIIGVVKHVHAIIKDAMTEDIDGDYAIIPGTKKKTLLKPGAEKLLMAFGLTGIPRTPTVTQLSNGHREVIVETEIRNIFTDRLHAVGIGSCSTMESKYRYRGGEKKSTGKQVPKEYWNLKDKPAEQLALIGGSGFGVMKDNGIWVICEYGEKQENPDIADVYNTVLKMAGKRSMIDGAIRATASSSMFTQDMEDAPPAKESAPAKTPLPKPSDAPKQEEKKEPPKKEQEPAKDKPAAAPAPKQEKPDDEVLSGCETKVTTIERYMLKEGATKGKAWHRHACLAEKEWYSTFSDTVGDLMKVLEKQNAMLYYKVQSTTAGTNNQLIWIEAVE